MFQAIKYQLVGELDGSWKFGLCNNSVAIDGEALIVIPLIELTSMPDSAEDFHLDRGHSRLEGIPELVVSEIDKTFRLDLEQAVGCEQIVIGSSASFIDEYLVYRKGMSNLYLLFRQYSATTGCSLISDAFWSSLESKLSPFVIHTNVQTSAFAATAHTADIGSHGGLIHPHVSSFRQFGVYASASGYNDYKFRNKICELYSAALRSCKGRRNSVKFTVNYPVMDTSTLPTYLHSKGIAKHVNVGRNRVSSMIGTNGRLRKVKVPKHVIKYILVDASVLHDYLGEIFFAYGMKCCFSLLFYTFTLSCCSNR